MELNLPSYKVRLKEESGKKFIFDEIRKKYLVLTPEEWVRQHFIQYLCRYKGVPASLIAVEKELKYDKLKKRTDILVYGQDGRPKLIVECKSPSVKITQETFDQIARYNMVLRVDYLVVTNGNEHYCCYMNYSNDQINFTDDIPNFVKYS